MNLNHVQGFLGENVFKDTLDFLDSLRPRKSKQFQTNF